MIKQDDKLVFVVGNSRSGTSMMRRILGKHSIIHTLNEVHFFEKFWSTDDIDKVLTEKEALWLANRLLFLDRYNVLETFVEEEFAEEAKKLIAELNMPSPHPHDIYHALLIYRAHQEGKLIGSEKTPQNLFYVNELLQLYPNCRIINLVRDPRGVLLSQKKKWMRKDSADSHLKDHKKEVLRLQVNYHPITISKLWNSAIKAIERFEDHPQVMSVRFEDITNNPVEVLEKTCAFLEVPFEQEMLNVAYSGSSLELVKGATEYGIKKNTVRSWESKLTKAEILICQWITGKNLERYGYDKVDVKLNPFPVMFYFLSFPVKVGLSFLMNIHRMRNVTEAVKRRLFA